MSQLNFHKQQHIFITLNCFILCLLFITKNMHVIALVETSRVSGKKNCDAIRERKRETISCVPKNKKRKVQEPRERRGSKRGLLASRFRAYQPPRRRNPSYNASGTEGRRGGLHFSPCSPLCGPYSRHLSRREPYRPWPDRYV